MKPWIANLCFILVEIILIGIAFIIGADAIECLTEGDLSGYFNEMSDLIQYVSIIDVILLIVSVLFLVVKPLRTKLTRFCSICNIVWILIQAVWMFLS